jgi:DNA-directed RNA polymerase specialized sigma24 family protein
MMINKPALHSKSSNGPSTMSQIHSETIDYTFARHRRVLHSVAYRVLVNHRDAEEAVQNLFLALPRNMPRFECEGSLRSWLLRSLIEEALTILRNRRIRLPPSARPGLNPQHFLSASGFKLRNPPMSFDR